MNKTYHLWGGNHPTHNDFQILFMAAKTGLNFLRFVSLLK
ncbi:hypothetical protein GGQ77_003221 [Geobacillus thermodenitrificans]|jgi:hypothetical protein|nr:hypothetical protein [Geobacillus thermodenitrificans]